MVVSLFRQSIESPENKKVMRNLIVPAHRVSQVVAVLYDRWSLKPYRRYAPENEGMYGCYASFCVNGVVYIDSELYGRFNSSDDLMLVAQVMELQSKWANVDYKEALRNHINNYSF